MHKLGEQFLREVRNELICITKTPERQLDKDKSLWFITQLNRQDAIIWHELPTYWAFFILFGDKKLWYKDYESYLIKRNHFYF